MNARHPRARLLHHPLRMQLRGWRWHCPGPGVRRHVTSPRGAVFFVEQIGNKFFALPNECNR